MRNCCQKISVQHGFNKNEKAEVVIRLTSAKKRLNNNKNYDTSI